ncbi:hypothetical protein CP02DC18_0855 [Chlamydia psittaci 02DC18]|nr:hypothetical protein CP02DC18_0855 [Chlamydia psittaci 02DC18]
MMAGCTLGMPNHVNCFTSLGCILKIHDQNARTYEGVR